MANENPADLAGGSEISKAEVRARALARRRELADKDRRSRAIFERFVGLPQYAGARTVLAYMHIRDEVRTGDLVAQLVRDGKRVVVPYCRGDSLELFHLADPGELAPGVLGIPEPRAELRLLAGKVVSPEELDLLAVPGLAFDRAGGRVGYGRGYFDRMLQGLRPDAFAAGIAFECQLFDRVPMGPLDVRLHAVVTEDDVYLAGQRKAKRAVVTGVSRGLGRAMAEGFVARGQTVAGCARSAEAIDQLQARYPRPHRFDVVDVRNDAAVAQWAAAVLAEGPVDLLVNNAAVINRNSPLWEVPQAEFDALVDINLKGTANVLRHFLPGMLRRQLGVVVNFSSGWGRSTSAEVAPYCASKWAIEGLTRALAEELPQGMAAIPLNPGVIDTEMLRSCFGDSASSYPTAQKWAERAVPFLLRLGPADNGQPLTVPE
ncbi:MAG: 5-formyltetrahydrofolate cyclo-ligase [Thermoguttaceae bacterium]